MKKNWKTTLAGLVFVATGFLSQAGVTLGHVGNSDWLGIINKAVAAIGLAYAKDKDVTGTGANARTDPNG